MSFTDEEIVFASDKSKTESKKVSNKYYILFLWYCITIVVGILFWISKTKMQVRKENEKQKTNAPIN